MNRSSDSASRANFVRVGLEPLVHAPMQGINISCSTCKIEKLPTMFGKGRKQCKQCISNRSRIARELKRESSVTSSSIEEIPSSSLTQEKIKTYSDDCVEERCMCSREMFVKWISKNMIRPMTASNYGSVWYFDHVIPVCYMYLDMSVKKYVLGWFNIIPVINRHSFVKNKYIDSRQAGDHLYTLRCYMEDENIKINGDIENYIDMLTEIRDKGKLDSIPATIKCCVCHEEKSPVECKLRRSICVFCNKDREKPSNQVPINIVNQTKSLLQFTTLPPKQSDIDTFFTPIV
jgi:hypothetical protein